MQILRAHDLIDVNWRNGGGITRKIATGVLGERTGWRVGRADVDVEGPFSDFSGLTRILTVVSPTGMHLLHDQGVFEARSWEPVEFDGGLLVESRLKDGPSTALNLMFDPELCSATAQVWSGVDGFSAAKGAGISVVHVLAGQPRCGRETFGEADTFFLSLTDQASVELGSGDAVLELRIYPNDHNADMRLCIADR